MTNGLAIATVEDEERMQIELNREEAELIRDRLRSEIRALDNEINRTDSIDYKRDLQKVDRTIERILGRIEGALQQESPRAE